MTDEEFQRVMEAGRKTLEDGKKALEQSTEVLAASKKTQNQQPDTPRDLIPQRLRDEWARDEERWNKRVDDLHQRRLALLDLRIERERNQQEKQTTSKPQRTTSGTLKKLWLESKLSKYELIKRTGLDKKSVYGHLAGRVQPDKKALQAYADVLSEVLPRPITVDDLS